MVLPEQYKMRCRVHMGVPVMGVQDSGFAFGYRFTNVMGLFEYRMNNLQPYEYAAIVGLPVAGGSIQGTPVAGQVVTATVNGTPYTYTVLSSDITGGSPIMSIAQNLANVVQAALGAAWTVTAQPAVTYPYTAIGASQPYWQICIVNSATTAFTLALSATGTLYAAATLQGAIPRPFYTFTDDQYIAYGYIGICDYLESKTAAASDLSSKYVTADVVDFRRDELDARDDNYTYWRQRMADYFGIPLFPLQPVGRFGGTNTGLIV